MKKRWKMVWVLCCVLIASGIICIIVAAAMGVGFRDVENAYPHGFGLQFDGGDIFGRDHDEDYKSSGDEEGSFDKVSELDIDIDAGGLKILTHKESYISVEKKGGSRRWNIDCYQDGEVLKISSDEYRVIPSFHVGTVYVYLPEDMVFQEAEISVGAGDFEVQNIVADSLSFDVGAGKGDVDYFETTNLDVKCGAGDVNASGKLNGDAVLDCGVGKLDLELDDKESNYNYDISVGIGKVRIGDDNYSGLDNGRHQDNDADKNIEVECGIGSAILSFQ